MRLAPEGLNTRVGRLARLSRQRDFSLAKLKKSPGAVARNCERGDVPRQPRTDRTGIPFEAGARWGEIGRLIPSLRERPGSPLGLHRAPLSGGGVRVGCAYV